jgi:hypothetical protein
MNNRQGARRSPTYHPRFWSLASAVIAICPLLIGSTAAAQVIIPIAGCNSQGLASGAEVFWTSSFATDAYVFDEDEDSRSGEIVSGTGDTLEVTVQWSTSAPETDSLAISFNPRGAGFSPGGVDGEVGSVEFNLDRSFEDPTQCGVDILALSYGSATFTLKFTSLHKPLRRGSGAAKGNAQFEVGVAFGDEVVRLGTNVHVATAPDPDE